MAADTPILLAASYGMAFGLMNDKIPLLPAVVRRFPVLERMAACPFCTGFHTGWFAWFVFGPREVTPDALAFAFASAASCYVVDTFVRWMEASLVPSGEGG